jgi:hypothetical protein
MDGGNIAYYWIAAVVTLALYLIVDEYKRK